MTSQKNESGKHGDDAKSKDKAEISKEYLLAEYKHFSDSFRWNEEIGEKRVNFFITLVTAVLAALVALATMGKTTFDFKGAAPLMGPAMLALLFVGFVTFLRIIKRNKVTDEYKDIIDKIRCRFKKLDPETLNEYKPFDCDPCNKEDKRKTGRRKYFSGGLVEIVAAINCIIAAGFGYTLAILCERKFAPVYGLVAFAIVLGVQVLILEVKTKPLNPQKSDKAG